MLSEPVTNRRLKAAGAAGTTARALLMWMQRP
jgi:hypothetical protein